MKKVVIAALFLAAAACMKKDAHGTYHIENPIASKKAKDKAHDNAAKSGEHVDKVMKRVEQGADKLAVRAGKGLEKAGKKLQETAKTDTRH